MRLPQGKWKLPALVALSILSLVFLQALFTGGQPNTAPSQSGQTQSQVKYAETTNQVSPTPSTQVPESSQPSNSELSNDNYYTNSGGDTIHSPAYSNTIPAGATAICGDGTYSFSQHRSGTCSHHGGVYQWL